MQAFCSADSVGQRADQFLQKRCDRLDGGTVLQAHEGELRSAVNGHEQVEFSLCRAHLGDVDVKVADWVGLKRLARKLDALDLRQPADAVALQTAMQ